MRKNNMFLTTLIGMGAGAFLYSYTKKHPLKMEMVKNKLKNMARDL